MLRCASSFVVATYEKAGLTPHDSRALPLKLACPSGYFTMSSYQMGKVIFNGNGHIGASPERKKHPV